MAKFRTRKAKEKRLQATCRNMYWLSIAQMVFLSYIILLSTVAIQEGFPGVSDVMGHAQKMDWGRTGRDCTCS